MTKVKIEDIITFLEKTEKLYRKKHNPLTIGRWESVSGENDYGSITFSKDIARKGYGKIGITIFSETKDGIEIKIELKISSDPDWEIFFQGFLEYNEDINTIYRLIGI